ncbi:MAG: hypothetical protein IT337_11095 [Thermomicrobiales bacterium]|nr:hypothetical protein [Thermomicrobiales bacterium]
MANQNQRGDDREQRGFVPVPGIGKGVPDLSAEVESGELSGEAAAAQLQESARRRAAEHGPDLDTNADGVISTSGPGSGQGMEKQRTGQ